jgi:hypothetical protein
MARNLAERAMTVVSAQDPKVSSLIQNDADYEIATFLARYQTNLQQKHEFQQ